METLRERHERLLFNDRTREAAAEAGQRWQRTGDDAKLAEDLDYIEAYVRGEVEALETAERVEREAVEAKKRNEEQLKAKVEQLADLKAPAELLAEILDAGEKGRFEEALAEADAMVASLQKQRLGMPGLEMVWRGAWDVEVEYQPGDVVRDEGVAYTCRAATLAVKPQLGVEGPWMVLVDPRRLVSYMPVLSGGGGSQGPPGEPGPQNLFIQPSAPVTSLTTYLWVQTEIGVDDDFTFWVEDGT